MALVAPASKTVRNKNLIFLAMCIAFAVWFGYDGFTGWPSANDTVVQQMLARGEQGVGGIDKEELPLLRSWTGWASATPAQRAGITELVRKTSTEGWHSAFEISLQQYLTYGLGAVSVGAAAMFLRHQRRRAIADENGLSPEPGLIIPWSDITKIDNGRWRKTGIVDLEYSGADGKIHRTVLDDYLLDELPPVLNELSVRADKAQFIPPEGAAAGAGDVAAEPEKA
jgi:hypothetical protein